MNIFSRHLFFIALVSLAACGNVKNKNISYSYVTDSVYVLSSEQKDLLTAELKELENSIGSQMAIIIIEDLNGEPIESYSLRIASEWRLGRKDYDDGVLITLSMNDRKMRIEVGQGLENILKDEIAAKIIREDMVPYFKQDNYYEGLLSAVQDVKNLLKKNEKLIGLPYNPGIEIVE